MRSQHYFWDNHISIYRCQEEALRLRCPRQHTLFLLFIQTFVNWLQRIYTLWDLEYQGQQYLLWCICTLQKYCLFQILWWRYNWICHHIWSGIPLHFPHAVITGKPSEAAFTQPNYSQNWFSLPLQELLNLFFSNPLFLLKLNLNLNF